MVLIGPAPTTCPFSQNDIQVTKYHLQQKYGIDVTISISSHLTTHFQWFAMIGH